MKLKYNIVEILRDKGIQISPDQEKLFIAQIKRDFQYIPKIGIFGKTGAGKSSLFNAIYGEDLCDVSDVEACTSKLQEADAGGVLFVDCPGIAESKEKDEVYMKMYIELIPTLDAIFWVLKGDDRAYKPDIEFYNSIKDKFVKKDGSKAPFFFVLNQVDKIEPFREWDVANHKPGPEQADNIEKKKDYVASVFETAPSKVIAVSASERYNLVTLVNNMLAELPDRESVLFYNDLIKKEKKRAKVNAELISNDKEIQKTASEKERNYVGEVLKRVGIKVASSVKSVISKIKKFFF